MNFPSPTSVPVLIHYRLLYFGAHQDYCIYYADSAMLLAVWRSNNVGSLRAISEKCSSPPFVFFGVLAKEVNPESRLLGSDSAILNTGLGRLRKKLGAVKEIGDNKLLRYLVSTVRSVRRGGCCSILDAKSQQHGEIS
jgi:hypothetical protein